VYLHKTSQTGPWFRRSVASRSSRRLGCAIRPVVCGIHGGQSGTGQIFLRALQLFAVSMSSPVLHTHFSFLLSECLDTHFSFLLSECLDTHLVFCCQNVSTRSQFSAVGISTPLLYTHPFSAVRMSRHALSFLLSKCLHTQSVFCCRYMSTIATPTFFLLSVCLHQCTKAVIHCP
jgi:hypothetical protein